ncbi:DUF6232 family protein [Actinoplanes sp. NPDC051859]|uniref:DUF6232 family protein n=1 Tax=Actinoplanes sp. NPDC051859 TaxID=3363909 RepID=UPI00378ACF65
MVTYYRDREVLVTSSGIRIGGHDYRLHDFAQVWHERGRRQWGAVAGRGAIGIAILAPVVIGAFGVLLALVIDASTSTTIALAGGGILVGLAAAPLADVLLEFMDRSYDRGSRRMEIWADVRGHRTMLLRTENAQRFGQIYRALQRALDHEPAPR